MPRPHRRLQLRPDLLLAQGFLHRVELADLAHEPRGGTPFTQHRVNASKRMGPATNQDQVAVTFPGRGFRHSMPIGLEPAMKILAELARPLPRPVIFH